MAEVLTQGLSAYIIDTTANTVTDLGCLFDADKISAPRSDIDTTGLCATDSKTYIAGLKDPGETTWTFKYDDTSSTGLTAIETLYDSGDKTTFAVGLSGSTDAPTVATGTITWPAGREFISFIGYVKDVSTVFEKDGIVTAEAVIKMASAHTKHG